MNTQLLLLNFRLSRFGLFAWALLLGAYGVLVVYLYPSIDDADHLVDGLLGLPVQLRTALGLSDDAVTQIFPEGRFTVVGALTAEYLIWLPVFVGIYAIAFGSGALARETVRGMLGTLLSLPLRRHNVLLAKSVVFTLALALLGIVSWGSVAITASIVDVDIGLGRLALVLTVGYLLMLAIFSYTILISALFPEPRSVLALSALITFVSYVLNLLAPSYSGVEWLENGSIFHFYQPLALLGQGEASWAGLGVYGGIVIFGHLAALVIFLRRDITT